MFDHINLFIAKAFAAEGAAPVVDAAAAPDTQSTLMRFAPLFLIFFVFYFLLIRPQQKKLEAQTALLKTLKKGDKVLMNSGIVGVVAKLLDDDKYVMVEIAKGVDVKVLRSTITELADDTKPANENKDKKN
ncbi:MAG: preprotein translocase subunit YajC [Bdellovibrionales bacterium]|jgi:preprotein translocase subunit YajC